MFVAVITRERKTAIKNMMIGRSMEPLCKINFFEIRNCKKEMIRSSRVPKTRTYTIFIWIKFWKKGKREKGIRKISSNIIPYLNICRGDSRIARTNG